MATYIEATAQEIALVLNMLALGEEVPDGFAYNPGWPEIVRKVDPDAALPDPLYLSRTAADLRYVISDTVRETVHNPGLSPLTTYHQALANADAAPCDILCVGDSLTEGYLLTDRDTRWLDRLLARIRDRWQPAGIAGGVGYYPGFYRWDTFPTLTYTGTTARNDNNGLGRRTMNVTNGTASLTFTGTSVRVLYSTGASGSAFTVTVDGGTAVNASSHNSTSGGVSTVGNTVDSETVASGEHTVVIATAGNMYLEGVMVFDGDEDAGIRIWDGAKSGATAVAGTVSLGSGGSWAGSVNAVDPDLVLLMLGSNDTRGGASVSAYTTGMQGVISTIRSVASPSIVLLVPPDPIFTDDDDYPDVAYIDAIYDLVAADPTLGLCDLAQRIGADGQDRGIVQSDNIHINALGHAMVANALAAYLEP